MCNTRGVIFDAGALTRLAPQATIEALNQAEAPLGLPTLLTMHHACNMVSHHAGCACERVYVCFRGGEGGGGAPSGFWGPHRFFAEIGSG